MLLSDDVMVGSSAIQLLWIYETTYEQLAVLLPHVYQPSSENSPREFQRACNRALEMIIRATTDTPVGRSQAKVPLVETDDKLVINRRQTQKVRPVYFMRLMF
jgi:hypothetical protein